MNVRGKINQFYKKYINHIIPQYSFISIIACFLVNCSVYFGTQQLLLHVKHYDLASSLDQKVPLISVFVWIYVLSYPFWLLNYIMIARKGKKDWFQFATGDMLSRLICGLIFCVLPTMTVRPDVHLTGISGSALMVIFAMDVPSNLFPSIHCLASWNGYIGVRGVKSIPLTYRIFCLVFSLLIFASTQFTKQHYLIDILGGVVLGEFCLWVGKHTKWYHQVEAFFDKLNCFIFDLDMEDFNAKTNKS